MNLHIDRSLDSNVGNIHEKRRKTKMDINMLIRWNQERKPKKKEENKITNGVERKRANNRKPKMVNFTN